jgi:hypothetical protein
MKKPSFLGWAGYNLFMIQYTFMPLLLVFPVACALLPFLMPRITRLKDFGFLSLEDIGDCCGAGSNFVRLREIPIMVLS